MDNMIFIRVCILAHEKINLNYKKYNKNTLKL